MSRFHLSDAEGLVLDLTKDSEEDISKIKEILFYLDYTEGKYPGTFVLGAWSKLPDILPFFVGKLKEIGLEIEIDANVIELCKSLSRERKTVEHIPEIERTEREVGSLPSLPGRDLKDHQFRAVEKLVELSNSADFSVPGSGKTTVALTIFNKARNDGQVDKLMVIGPVSCFDPWEEEWGLCFGKAPKSLRLVGSAHQRRAKIDSIDNCDLLLCSYQMAYRDKDLLQTILRAHHWMLTLDESHNIKRYEGGVWAESLLALAPYAVKRMILSGTPAPRSLEDLWTQFTFLWPSQAVLGSRTAFEDSIAEEGVNGISQKLGPFFHRTRKQDLGLPDPIVDMSILSADVWPIRQRKIIRILETRTLRELRTLDFSSKDLQTISRWRRARIIRLLQAASNPAMLAGRSYELGDAGPSFSNDADLEDLVLNYDRHEVSAKLSYTLRQAREIIGRSRKVVIWTWFIRNIKFLEEQLNEFHPLTAYGEIKPFEEEFDDEKTISRERNIREFRSERDRWVLIANPSACSESISLHKECHEAIYVERTFNCGQFLQSMDRIHRVGLPDGETATYHLPVMNCAIDRLVDRRLIDRQKMMYGVLSDQMLPVGGIGESGLFDEEYDLDSVIEDLRRILAHESGGSE